MLPYTQAEHDRAVEVGAFVIFIAILIFALLFIGVTILSI